MPTATIRHTRRPPTKTAKAQAAPTGTPKPTRAPSTPKKAPKPAKPPTAKAASSRPSRAPTKKPVRRNNTAAATTSKPPVKATKPPAKPTRFWRALGLSAAGVAAAAGLYAAYRKRGTLMAAVQPVLQRMTPAEKARFVKKCNAKGVKGKTAKGVVKGVDKGRGKAGYVSAVVVAVVALVLAVSYSLGKTRSGLSGRDGNITQGVKEGQYREMSRGNETSSNNSENNDSESEEIQAIHDDIKKTNAIAEQLMVDSMETYINEHKKDATFIDWLKSWENVDYRLFCNPDSLRSFHNYYTPWAKACTKYHIIPPSWGKLPSCREEGFRRWLETEGNDITD